MVAIDVPSHDHTDCDESVTQMENMRRRKASSEPSQWRFTGVTINQVLQEREAGRRLGNIPRHCVDNMIAPGAYGKLEFETKTGTCRKEPAIRIIWRSRKKRIRFAER